MLSSLFVSTMARGFDRQQGRHKYFSKNAFFLIDYGGTAPHMGSNFVSLMKLE
jgi:hypothetical protein